MYRIIDLENWERKDHFIYYTQHIQCGFSITANLDVSILKKTLDQHHLQFYPSFIYCVSYNINSIPEFRIRWSDNNQLILYDIVHPSYTIFHKSNHTFSDLWSEYTPHFFDFYRNYQSDIDKYSEKLGVKIKPEQPKNFYCISCVPWLSFTGYSTYNANAAPPFMPIITFGKYHEENGKWLMPLTVTISHAVVDGYHVSKLVNSIQETINTFQNHLRRCE